MTAWMKLAIALAVVIAVGSIVGTIWVGAQVREESLAARPHPAGAPGAAAGCDLAAGPCTAALPGGGEVRLDLSPRPLRTMADLAVRAEVRGAEAAAVAVSFSMTGMSMGENVSRLAPEPGGAFAGKAVLVRCPSGRRDWTAEVVVERAGAAPARARLPFTVGD